ncbi:uncharacterized protein LOC127288359 [Leptopilina boulardi]|uniref:uncharacterized protein LOC127288359 n=1 Tax=Leptopilina boulardi TaxID=63433 RepID=UPI0021F55680|nr:uncharacterized protein LOC127288359 [Leptopilina boulardi]
MDSLISVSPLATVQLIPVINYLNLLSDYLFTENYLAEVNRKKQIPIVNALYDYFEENQNNLTMQLKLIRYLLQGSDLYGEEDNENVDEIFVNTMFEYIISSLVFDKYGNIYGFLADTIRKVENLQFDNFLNVIKETLKNATFDNEYGSNSILTKLAVNRIYKDIILPIFPKPKTNLSILSLDYIFAQAGSTYLRLGRIKNTYYSDFQNNNFKYSHEIFFDEYLIVGHIVRNLINLKKIDVLTLRVFALPALLYYVTTEIKVKNEIITNVIFNYHHWEAAYHKFLEYMDNAYTQIENQLKNDYKYQMHLRFLSFQNRAVIAKSLIDSQCNFLSKEQREKEFITYIRFAEYFECSHEVVLPNLNILYKNQINTLADMYGNYDLEIIKQCFKKSLIRDLHGVTINLVVNNNELVNNDFNNFLYLSYDLLEFYYSNNKTIDYYALVRKSYTVTLIKETDDPVLFQIQCEPFLNDLIRFGQRIILKLNDDEENKLFENLIHYKKERFNSFFSFSNYNLKNGKWWKEFGLSLVPSYPCLTKIISYDTNKETLCEKENLKFLNNFTEDILLYITDLNTQSLLSSFGTTIKTVFLIETINSISALYNSSEILTQLNLDIQSFYKQVSLHIEEPKFETISITKDGIKLVSKILSNLTEKINFNFTSVNYTLNKMEVLKYSFMREIGAVGIKKSRKLFVNSLYPHNGFGYKFIKNYNRAIALLRTDYELKEKMFVTLVLDFPESRKKYIKLNNMTFEYEPNYFIYEINNQLRRKTTRLRFNGIKSYHDDEKCLDDIYLEQTKHSDKCLRHWRFVKQLNQKEGAVELLKNKVIIDGEHIASEQEIRNQLKKYTFPDDNIFLLYFVTKWIENKKFEESDWSSSCIIENVEILDELRYDLVLETKNLTIPEGNKRINSIYTYRERRKIENGASIENMIRDFNNKKAGFSVTFEDYYAIQNFVTSGYTRIIGDTPEAKRMKLALYRLAIRQSDDLRHEFEGTLFFVESVPLDTINYQLYVGKKVVFQKFSMTSTTETAATRFVAYAPNGFRNILYEMKFDEPYIRATIETKVDRFEPVIEKNIILLPGCEFEIVQNGTIVMGGIGNVMKVVLYFNPKSNKKYDWYKDVMREISKINL